MKFIKIFFTTWIVYFTVFFISPLKPVFEIELEGIIILILGILAVPLGLLSSYFFKPIFTQISNDRMTHFSYEINEETLNILINRINILGLVGCIFILIDRFYIRDVVLFSSFFDVRTALEDSSTSAFGLLGNFLSGLAVFSFGLITYKQAISNNVSLKQRILCYLVTILFLLSQVMVGSRSGILVFVLVSFFFIAWSNYVKSLPIITSNIKKFLFYGFLFLIISGQIFITRIDEMGLTAIFSITSSGYSFSLQPTDNWLQIIQQFGAIAENTLLAFTSIIMYIYHGIFEFFILVENFDDDHTLGKVSFWFPIKLLSYLGADITEIEIENISGVRPGIFTMFLGPLYIDFGVFMPLVVFLLFLIFGIFMHNITKENIVWLPFGAIFAATLILFPVLNLMASASGAYPLFSSFFIPLLSKKIMLYSRK